MQNGAVGRGGRKVIGAAGSGSAQGQMTRRGLLCGLGAAAALPLVSAAGLAEGLEQAPANRPAAKTYRNPLAVEIGDPYVLREAGGKAYYAYGSGGGEQGSRTAFPTFRSTDLVHWTPVGETYAVAGWDADILPVGGAYASVRYEAGALFEPDGDCKGWHFNDGGGRMTWTRCRCRLSEMRVAAMGN